MKQWSELSEDQKLNVRRFLATKEGQQLMDGFKRKCTCGETSNLTEVKAIPGSTYHLCAGCLKEERQS